MTKSLPPAKFVFQGTVVRLKDATMTVPDRSKTAIIRVDTILRAPEALHGHAGTEITVLPAKGERLKAGQQAVFHTNGWLYGKSLAVQSVGHEAVPKRATGAALPDPARVATEHAIAERAAKAPLVVSGKVLAVGLPAGAQPAATAAGRAPALPPPISEHEPFWSEAVIAIQKVHKGVLQQKQVVVRFPASQDVRWYHAPKFQVGQEGVFLLHPDRVTGAQTLGVAAAAHNVAPVAYTCLHATDFQPADQPHAVAAVLQSMPSNP
jgi:hypothetical protein